MFVTKTRYLIVLLMLVVIFFTASIKASNRNTSERTIEEKLAQQVEVFDSKKTSTTEQLIEVGQHFHVPIGIEWVVGSKKSSAKPVHIVNKTVKDVISEILEQQSGAKFELNNGVLHIFNSPLIYDPQNFLNIQLPEFSISKENLFRASFHLRCSIYKHLHPEEGCGGGTGYGIPRNDGFDVRNITFSGRDLTVRQILNGLVAAQGNALWVVRLKQSKRLPDEPFYAPIPLLGNKPASDFHWDLIPLRVSK